MVVDTAPKSLGGLLSILKMKNAQTMKMQPTENQPSDASSFRSDKDEIDAHESKANNISFE